MSYEGIRITEELSESSQRAVGITPRRHETLGELVKDMARRADLRSEDPLSQQPTRHEVTVDGEILHTNCFGDALALPFVLRDETFEVRSESPTGGEVRATVTKDGAEASPPDAVVSFGAIRAGDGPVQATACPYINAFPSRAAYERWAEATPQAVTIALPVGDAFALVRDLVAAGPEGAEGMVRSC
jgi:alkylmercury lyase